MSERFGVGDWVVVNYHQRYEPGQVIKILPEDRTYGSLYRIDFGRFTLHLSDDEISRDSGPPG